MHPARAGEARSLSFAPLSICPLSPRAGAPGAGEEAGGPAGPAGGGPAAAGPGQLAALGGRGARAPEPAWGGGLWKADLHCPAAGPEQGPEATGAPPAEVGHMDPIPGLAVPCRPGEPASHPPACGASQHWHELPSFAEVAFLFPDVLPHFIFMSLRFAEISNFLNGHRLTRSCRNNRGRSPCPAPTFPSWRHLRRHSAGPEPRADVSTAGPPSDLAVNVAWQNRAPVSFLCSLNCFSVNIGQLAFACGIRNS